MKTRIPMSLRNRLRARRFQQALISALAAMALTACGGGGTDTGANEAASAAAEAALAPQGATIASTVTMTKVHFTNADGQALTGFLFQDSAAAPRNATVVMMHGCAGVWSNGIESMEPQPPLKALSHIHKRWGETLARAGYTGLLVDSFSERGLTNECNNGSAGLNEATVRPRDAAALLSSPAVVAHLAAEAPDPLARRRPTPGAPGSDWQGPLAAALGFVSRFGGVAQLVERLGRIEEARGSIPLTSTPTRQRPAGR